MVHKFKELLADIDVTRLLLFAVLLGIFIAALVASLLSHHQWESKYLIENIQTLNPSSYIYNKTSPINIGKHQNANSAFIDLKLRFRVLKNSSGYPNLFQTAPENSGIRMEFLNNTASLVIPDKSMVGGLRGIVISSNIKLGQWYDLDIDALNGSYVSIYLDGKRIELYKSPGINFSMTEILIGQGFNSTRKFEGEIKDISIGYGKKTVKNNLNAVFNFSNLLAIAALFWVFFVAAKKFKLNIKLLGLCCSIIPVALYNIFIFNRYFPITEGWFSVFSHLIQNGKLPYKDFYLFLTPLYPLLLAAFQSIFGEEFFLLRILGLAVNILTAIFLYLILARRFSVISACLIATMTPIYISGGTAYIGYDFLYFCLLFALISLYLLLVYIDKRVDTSINFSFPPTLFFSGFFLSLAFLTKQSNGALISLFGCIAAVIAVSQKPSQSRIRYLLIFTFGTLAPLILIGIWLYFVGAAKPFIDQVLFGAIASKGESISKVLFGWIGRNASKDFLIQTLTIGFIVGLFLVFINAIAHFLDRFYRTKISVRHGVVNTTIYFWAFFFCCVIIFVFGQNKYISNLALWMVPWYADYKFFIQLSLLWSFFFICSTLYKISKSQKLDIPLTIIFLFSIGILFGNGTSVDISEAGTFLIIATSLGFFANLSKISWITTPIVGMICLSLTMTLAVKKFEVPYYWWSVKTPSIWNSTSQSRIPLLKGMNIPPLSIKLIEEVVEAIKDHSTPSDEVITFPNIPLFYLLSERWPNSKVLVAWFDILPDNLAIAEAERIKLSPPKVIVNLKLAEFVWREHELSFRKGLMGQRQINFVIQSLIKDLDYKLAYSRLLEEGDGDDAPQIEVWYR